MTIEIETMGAKESNVAFCFSTKDRPDLTYQTITPILQESGFDLYWIDGSKDPENQKLPLGYMGVKKVKEIHRGVVGGADVAILYSLSLLLEKGYEYIGLIENDVLLEQGWFKKILDLFKQGENEGLIVGSVSARSYQVRMLIPRGNYAVMKNVGAGMVLFRRKALVHVLNSLRTGTVGEPSFAFSYYTGKQGIIPWQINASSDQQVPKFRTCMDWFFESSMLPYGYMSLALTPSMAKNIDGAPDDVLQLIEKPFANEVNWQDFVDKLALLSIEVNDPYRRIMNNYDPVGQVWHAFPHQILLAMPKAFGEGWSVKWNMYMGPFTFLTKEDECSIQILFHGIMIGLFVMHETEDFVITLEKEGAAIGTPLQVKSSKEWQLLKITCNDAGPHNLNIIFDRPGIQLGRIFFEGPQSWFKHAYPLRYKDLEPYLEG